MVDCYLKQDCSVKSEGRERGLTPGVVRSNYRAGRVAGKGCCAVPYRATYTAEQSNRKGLVSIK